MLAGAAVFRPSDLLDELGRELLNENNLRTIDRPNPILTLLESNSLRRHFRVGPE